MGLRALQELIECVLIRLHTCKFICILTIKVKFVLKFLGNVPEKQAEDCVSPWHWVRAAGRERAKGQRGGSDCQCYTSHWVSLTSRLWSQPAGDWSLSLSLIFPLSLFLDTNTVLSLPLQPPKRTQRMCSSLWMMAACWLNIAPHSSVPVCVRSDVKCCGAPDADGLQLRRCLELLLLGICRAYLHC